MRDNFDRDRDFRFGWTCPSCDKNFNPSIDECKYCNYTGEKMCVDENEITNTQVSLTDINDFRKTLLKEINK